MSDAGRAVFVTDIRAREPLAYWGPYGASKAAAANLVLCWAGEVAIPAAGEFVRSGADADPAAGGGVSGGGSGGGAAAR